MIFRKAFKFIDTHSKFSSSSFIYCAMFVLCFLKTIAKPGAKQELDKCAWEITDPLPITDDYRIDFSGLPECSELHYVYICRKVSMVCRVCHFISAVVLMQGQVHSSLNL